MENLQLFTIIVSISSILLAIVAITLSILFYVWSRKSNEDIQKTSIHIDHNTEKIEKLFDRFYTDTFGIMKGTIAAMQKSVFPDGDSESESIGNLEAEKGSTPEEIEK